MRILDAHADPDGFFRRLAEARTAALLLDYDGTLAPFREEKDRAVPYPGVRESLDRILRRPAVRLVIVSGRWTRDLLPLLGLARRPEIWGSHGLERLHPDGAYEVAPLNERALRGLARADEWLEEAGLQERSEKKPGAVAIHWRGLSPEREEEIRSRTLEAWSLGLRDAGLLLREFDGGMELLVPGRTKGDAVRTILGEMPPDAPAAYLGDDVTDEDAFAALKGRGLGVLVRPRLRPTAADIWIRPPAELLGFLARWT